MAGYRRYRFNLPSDFLRGQARTLGGTGYRTPGRTRRGQPGARERPTEGGMGPAPVPVSALEALLR